MYNERNHKDVFAELMLQLFIMGFAMTTPIIIGRIVMDETATSILLQMSLVGAIAGLILCLIVRHEFKIAHEEELAEAKRLRAIEITGWCAKVHHEQPYGWIANHQISFARRRERDEELASYYR